MMRLRRSCLVVPGTSARMLRKATTLPADQIIIDLEDGVAPDAKASARVSVSDALAQLTFAAPTVSVRINALDSPWASGDLAALCDAPVAPDTVVVPKVGSAGEVTAVAEALARDAPPGLEVQIENAVGLRDIAVILAASPQIEACIVGPGDLSASLGMPGTTIGAAADVPGDPWVPLLSTILVQARAAGVQAIDGPYARLDDMAGLAASAARSHAIGYDGKWVIHPSQIAPVTTAFGITQDDFEHACDLLDAYAAAADTGAGAAVFGREMIDAATRRMAEWQRLRGLAEGREVRPTPADVPPEERAAWRQHHA